MAFLRISRKGVSAGYIHAIVANTIFPFGARMRPRGEKSSRSVDNKRRHLYAREHHFPKATIRKLTRRDTVGIKGLFLGEFFAPLFRLLLELLCFFSSTETTTPLLIHLCARGNAINGQEEKLLWFDLREEMLYIGEYC